jgi:hypothetical protein
VHFAQLRRLDASLLVGLYAKDLYAEKDIFLTYVGRCVRLRLAPPRGGVTHLRPRGHRRGHRARRHGERDDLGHGPATQISGQSEPL